MTTQAGCDAARGALNVLLSNRKKNPNAQGPFVKCVAPAGAGSDSDRVPVFGAHESAQANNLSMSLLLPPGTPLFDLLPEDGQANGALCYASAADCAAGVTGLNWLLAPPAPPPAPPPMAPGFTRCGDPR